MRPVRAPAPVPSGGITPMGRSSRSCRSSSPPMVENLVGITSADQYLFASDKVAECSGLVAARIAADVCGPQESDPQGSGKGSRKRGKGGADLRHDRDDAGGF